VEMEEGWEVAVVEVDVGHQAVAEGGGGGPIPVVGCIMVHT